ncbi:putative lipid-transfer protein DIR1 [Cornus florida]|uniref:putative lipid-transfer protein DIR1 n=1 Tax=Cornus florida TaxID=4283 RepID=UPI00289AFD69|nr:putative lipid-transfer protein DIR1 [Cornus florida]
MEAYTKLVLVALVVAMAFGSEPVEAAFGQSICGMTTDGLMSCKPSVAAGVNPLPAPTPACCSALSKADMQCLCSFKSSSLLPTLGVDPDLAMQLPAKCNLVQSVIHC